MNRQAFLKTAAFGIGSAAIPGRWRFRLLKRFHIGHTAITWGYSPANTPQAIHDVSSAGFHSFECFGNALEYWEERGGLGKLLDSSNMALQSVYCPVNLTDPARRKEQLDELITRGRLLRKYGGKVAVIGPNGIDRETYNFSKYKADIVNILNELAKALNGIGVKVALHQHKNSCIESRDELYAVMDAADTRYLKLCPDFGHLYDGGLDPVRVVKDFLPLVAHVHIKDFGGGSSYNGFCPLGKGKVDIAGILEVLEQSDKNPSLMAELNPPPKNASTAPLELIRINKKYLESLGYAFHS
ncbi:sugar phosphate isomerase/epimerase [Aliifodinibius sp. S!AR15-10]|uniref:sugar phosphate isomerase/epimerase family protein n=1 Tax=Aliifodinibius sp. S!AR15-10 TaxID=2950437 RepID=UPI00285D1E4D|nr:sugar phosphate isomerase/epimerase [Aliifodinibius sp. S!AR15-10]MDR8394095.1 sugar phosphate isomerase/epimerase [Aliifodinibius sp. S!AR15-10]